MTKRYIWKCQTVCFARAIAISSTVNDIYESGTLFIDTYSIILLDKNDSIKHWCNFKNFLRIDYTPNCSNAKWEKSRWMKLLWSLSSANTRWKWENSRKIRLTKFCGKGQNSRKHKTAWKLILFDKHGIALRMYCIFINYIRIKCISTQIVHQLITNLKPLPLLFAYRLYYVIVQLPAIPSSLSTFWEWKLKIKYNRSIQFPFHLFTFSIALFLSFSLPLLHFVRLIICCRYEYAWKRWGRMKHANCVQPLRICS